LRVWEIPEHDMHRRHSRLSPDPPTVRHNTTSQLMINLSTCKVNRCMVRGEHLSMRVPSPVTLLDLAETTAVWLGCW